MAARRLRWHVRHTASNVNSRTLQILRNLQWNVVDTGRVMETVGRGGEQLVTIRVANIRNHRVKRDLGI